MFNADQNVQMFVSRVAEWLRNTNDLRKEIHTAIARDKKAPAMQSITALLAVAVSGAKMINLSEDEFLAMCEVVFKGTTPTKKNDMGVMN